MAQMVSEHRLPLLASSRDAIPPHPLHDEHVNEHSLIFAGRKGNHCPVHKNCCQPLDLVHDPMQKLLSLPSHCREGKLV